MFTAMSASQRRQSRNRLAGRGGRLRQGCRFPLLTATGAACALAAAAGLFPGRIHFQNDEKKVVEALDGESVALAVEEELSNLLPGHCHSQPQTDTRSWPTALTDRAVAVPIKPTEAGRRLLHKEDLRPPYDGAKDYFYIAEVDDRQYLASLVKATCDELPAPKPKKRKSSLR